MELGKWDGLLIQTFLKREKCKVVIPYTRHFRPGVSTLSRFFDGALVALAVAKVVLLADGGEMLLLSDDDVAGDKSSWRREDQSQGAARERLLRALPGTEVSVGKAGGELGPVENVVAEEELSVVMVEELMFATGMNCRF
ncbi:hypothetical protein H5410_018994 [Solanum commersonii]|uniref:Uncharacterized protein n=1 Tax=Solanum commersonii TaxID=4109 RepID=A0A9J6A4A2_SOLCO|nr:hypothetical protein H5410_018994 [Solanum commersonii]